MPLSSYPYGKEERKTAEEAFQGCPLLNKIFIVNVNIANNNSVLISHDVKLSFVVSGNYSRPYVINFSRL